MDIGKITIAKIKIDGDCRACAFDAYDWRSSPYSGFLDMPHLKKVAKSSRAVKEIYDSNNLMNIDLHNTIKAWDSYNQEGGLNLPSIKPFRDFYAKQHGHAKHGTRAKILGWKKAWILEKRQKEKEEASRSEPRVFHSSPLLGGSPDVDDSFADLVGNGQSSMQTRVPFIQDPSNSKNNPLSNADSRDYEEGCAMIGGDNSPASQLNDSQENFVVDNGHKAARDISLPNDVERASKLVVKAYDMFSDDGVEGAYCLEDADEAEDADDVEVPQDEAIAGLQLVDTITVVINTQKGF
ncbi:uncharacterized protein EAE97_004002 [Botrytis byssoidea]|uniref:Uncharacterized protein n=1 Tax=Botrytis byssoidea TaxID=139641 RepID=A0A9P5ITI1_9HELO|nr:uncharacterized protein EAE97_004002 [Botrytis byssoidea]KAF7948591.1 hypothetical protein EAE97_004002 [Botrytis byssoidea]